MNGTTKAKFYWDLVDKKIGTLAAAKSNVDAALALGVCLTGCTKDSKDWKAIPVQRAALLYELLRVHCGDLFDYEMKFGPHLGTTRPGPGDRKTHLYRASKMPGAGRDAWRLKWVDLINCKVDPKDWVDQRVAEAATAMQHALGSETGIALARSLFELRMEFCDLREARMLQERFSRKNVVVAGAFCPDYTYRLTGDPSRPFEYLFNGVDDGVGVVAQQFARIIGPLLKFFDSIGVNHETVVGIGDFEAYDEGTLQRVNATQDEFLNRCRRSLTAFREQVGYLPITLEMCDADGMRGSFQAYREEAYERMMRDDFGQMSQVGDPIALVREIAADNATFYRRWHGETLTDQEVYMKVLRQGAEYAALSRSYIERFGLENLVGLSGDRPRMHRFDDFAGIYPTLRAKRCY